MVTEWAIVNGNESHFAMGRNGKYSGLQTIEAVIERAISNGNHRDDLTGRNEKMLADRTM
jgi:hypothetical protein